MLLPGSSDAALILRFCACFLGIFKIGRQEKYFNKKIIGNKPFFTNSNSVLINHIKIECVKLKKPEQIFQLIAGCLAW